MSSYAPTATMDLPEPTPHFADRRDAGRRLAARLAHHHAAPRTIVLGLPRGGVVPAAEVAAALALPLDVLLARKLGAPGDPEFAIGAVAEEAAPWLDDESAAATGASPAFVAAALATARGEIARQRTRLRAGRPLDLPAGATVILVDDGVATGASVIAAIRAVRTLGVGRVVLAVPVAPPDTALRLRELVDELVVLATPDPFVAVGDYYDDFVEVHDDDVAVLLAAAQENVSPPRRAHAAR